MYLLYIWPSGNGLIPQRGAKTPLNLALSFIDGEVQVSHMEVYPATLSHQQLRLSLSQPSGRSLSGQCDFLPPGFVVTEALHKPRLWVLPSENSTLIGNIARALLPLLFCTMHASAPRVSCNLRSVRHVLCHPSLAPPPVVLKRHQPNQTLWRSFLTARTDLSQASILTGVREKSNSCQQAREERKELITRPGARAQMFLFGLSDKRWKLVPARVSVCL